MHPLFPLVHVSIGVPAKLSDDDVFLAWTGIVIPSAAAVASVFVATVSVFIAWKARKIAEDSELARVKAESDRVRYEQEQRLDSALRDLFVGISNRISAVLAHPGEFERALRSDKGLRSAPMRPDPSSVLVLIAAARLEARQVQEREMLEVVRAFVSNLSKGVQEGAIDLRKMWTDSGSEAAWLETLCVWIDQWRNADSRGRERILEKMAKVDFMMPYRVEIAARS
jgi:hypothetical protein